MPTRYIVDDDAPVVSVGAFRVERVVDYLFGILYAILGLRLVVEVLNARPSGVVTFLQRVSDPFYAPFRGMFGTSTIEGLHVPWALVAAIIGYMILHGIIRGLISLVGRM